MNTTRRQFLWNAVAMAAAGCAPGALWAAMKYDRDGVLDLFRLMAEAINARVRCFHGSYELEAIDNGKTIRQDFRINPDFSDRMEMRFAV